MQRRVFNEIKTELARIAGQSGMVATDTRLREAVTVAQERLCTMGEWPFQYARVRVAPQGGGIVILPTDYEALVFVSAAGDAVEIRPPGFEFVEFGPGPNAKLDGTGIGIDLGDSPVRVQPDGSTLKIVSTSGADSGNVVISGYDSEGVSQEITLALPEAVSNVKMAAITKVTKPVTVGDVVLTYTDEFGTESVGADWRPRDTTPSFRRYRLPESVCGCQSVSGIARRRLFPVRADSDDLFITNLSALRHGVRAVALEDSGKLDQSEASFAIAAKILADEAAKYRATAPAPVVKVSRISNLSVRPDIF